METLANAKNERAKMVLYTANSFKSFVRSEIEWLRKQHPESIVVTSERNRDKETYSNTICSKDFYSTKEKVRHLLQYLPELIGILFNDLFSKGTSIAYFIRVRNHFSLLLKCSMVCEELFQNNPGLNDSISYTFFANDYAFSLALAVKRGHTRAYSTRVHGRDVIEEREPNTRKLPFQAVKYSYAKHVYCVSRATQQYVTDKYPEFASKINVAYLGSEDHGIGPTKPSDIPYHIVSVGRVRNVKRFYLIAEMLQYVDLPIKWSHFGDVQENDPTSARYKEAVAALAAKPNIEVLQRGYVENADLLQSYKSHYVDLLINSSENEGLPVSIQEAISFGIPCLATDVGGTSDIVNEHTGILVDPTFGPKAVSKEVVSILEGRCRDVAFRQGVRTFWEKHFDASKNYPAFFERLRADKE